MPPRKGTAFFMPGRVRLNSILSSKRIMNNKIQYQSELAVRIDDNNPDHHIYNNNGTLWIHFTVYPSAITKQRIRKSLKTKNVKVARRLRDQLFATFPKAA
jgi:hypothetical protein